MIKYHFILRTRDYLKFYRLSGAKFYDCISTIYQFTKPFLDNKMSIFEEYGTFKMLITTTADNTEIFFFFSFFFFFQRK